MKYISLFAGIGGFDYALNKLGMECVYANEWDKYAAQIYNKNLRTQQGQDREGINIPLEGYSGNAETTIGKSARLCDTRDIRTVPTEEIADHDLLVGGFPCQAFSIAGKRRGFDDTRGTLFFEIARILKDKHTKYFILENVKGLLSHANGDTFKTIISTLDELGYDLQWQVLNSKNFGVPQNRERVFIVGNLRGEPRPEVFPIGKDGGEYVRTSEEKSGSGKGIRVSDYAGTLRAKETKSGSDTVIREGNIMRIRRLTPLECERLQGFPDGWTEGISDTQRYKCLGNAVTTNVVYEVAKRLVNSLRTICE